MSPLKFRAWHKEQKLMSHIFTLEDLLEEQGISFYPHKISSSGLCSMYGHIEELEIMRFTELTDKNGKEIYEGDIIKDCFLRPFLRPQVWVVPYIVSLVSCCGWNARLIGCIDENTNEFVRLRHQNRVQDEWVAHSKDYEVIGNIYENPELVKDK